MKTTLKFGHVIIFCLLICFGCSKDSVEEEIGSNYGTMQAKIQGANTTLRPYSSVTEFYTNGSIGVFGLNCDELISISLKFPDSIGTFSFIADWDYERGIIGVLEAEGGFFPCVSMNTYYTSKKYYAIDGTVTITETNSNIVKGTFNFIGENSLGETRTVTDGAFNITRESN
jgi:hypothetical protein